AVVELALDEIRRRRVDRRDAVERDEHRLLPGPELDHVGDRRVERLAGIVEEDVVTHPLQRRRSVEGLAERVDEAGTRAEMLVERRPRDAGAGGDLLERRLVERA